MERPVMLTRPQSRDYDIPMLLAAIQAVIIYSE